MDFGEEVFSGCGAVTRYLNGWTRLCELNNPEAWGAYHLDGRVQVVGFDRLSPSHVFYSEHHSRGLPALEDEMGEEEEEEEDAVLIIHPNIQRTYASAGNGLISEYVQGTDLHSQQSPDQPTFFDTMTDMEQLLSALHYLRARGAVHGEIIPETVLRNPQDNHCTLMETYLVQLPGAPRRASRADSPYASPQPDRQDIFSLGLTFGLCLVPAARPSTLQYLHDRNTGRLLQGLEEAARGEPIQRQLLSVIHAMVEQDPGRQGSPSQCLEAIRQMQIMHSFRAWQDLGDLTNAGSIILRFALVHADPFPEVDPLSQTNSLLPDIVEQLNNDPRSELLWIQFDRAFRKIEGWVNDNIWLNGYAAWLVEVQTVFPAESCYGLSTLVHMSRREVTLVPAEGVQVAVVLQEGQAQVPLASLKVAIRDRNQLVDPLFALVINGTMAHGVESLSVIVANDEFDPGEEEEGILLMQQFPVGDWMRGNQFHPYHAMAGFMGLCLPYLEPLPEEEADSKRRA